MDFPQGNETFSNEVPPPAAGEGAAASIVVDLRRRALRNQWQREGAQCRSQTLGHWHASPCRIVAAHRRLLLNSDGAMAEGPQVCHVRLLPELRPDVWGGLAAREDAKVPGVWAKATRWAVHGAARTTVSVYLKRKGAHHTC